MPLQYDPIDREPIWAALSTLLEANVSGLTTIGRRHVRPPQLAAEQQPALFVVQMREHREPRPAIGAPVKLTLQGFLILYLQAPVPLDEGIGAESQLGATLLNAFFKQIDQALQPDTPNGKLTLGGLVEHCWIQGDVDMDPGIVSQQAAAIVPVHMLVP